MGGEQPPLDMSDSQQDEDDMIFIKNVLRCQNPQCNHYLRLPIGQCEQGHSMCPICAWGSQCPVCKSAMIKTRNIALDTLVNGLPLSNRVSSSNGEDGDQNYKTKTSTCPECDWLGDRQDMLKHVVVTHRADTSLGPNMTFIAQSYELTQCNHHKIMLYHGEVFITRLVYQQNNNSLYGAVQILDKERAPNFRYEFVVTRNTGGSISKYNYIRDIHTMDVSFNTIFEGKDCFIFLMNHADYFLNGDGSVTIDLNIKERGSKPASTLAEA